MVIFSSLIISIIGGIGLQAAGVGYQVDHMLGKNFDQYMSQEKHEAKMWLLPEQGRLLGTLLVTEKAATSAASFADTYGNEWELSVGELTQRDLTLLRSQRLVRIVGTSTDVIKKKFHACGVFPWMFDRNSSIRELGEERQQFIDQAYDRMHAEDERVKLLEQETYRDVDPYTMSLCAELGMMKRMKFDNH